MPFFTSPRFLRNVLLADAASCLASGALQLLWTAFAGRPLEPAAAFAGGHRLVPARLRLHGGLHRDPRSAAAAAGLGAGGRQPRLGGWLVLACWRVPGSRRRGSARLDPGPGGLRRGTGRIAMDGTAARPLRHCRLTCGAGRRRCKAPARTRSSERFLSCMLSRSASRGPAVRPPALQECPP